MRLPHALACVALGASLTLPLSGQSSDQYRWDLPPRVAPPLVPTDKPLKPARVELGRRLFYDARSASRVATIAGRCYLCAIRFMTN